MCSDTSPPKPSTSLSKITLRDSLARIKTEMVIGFGLQATWLLEVQLVLFLLHSFILLITPEPDYPTIWRVPRREEKSNLMVWLMSTKRLWLLTVSPVCIEALWFLVLVLSFTGDSTLEFMTLWSPTSPKKWGIVFWSISCWVGVWLWELVWLLTPLIQFEEEWWWLQGKVRNILDRLIVLKRSSQMRDSNHSSRVQLLISWEVWQVQVCWPFTTSCRWSCLGRSMVEENDLRSINPIVSS